MLSCDIGLGRYHGKVKFSFSKTNSVPASIILITTANLSFHLLEFFASGEVLSLTTGHKPEVLLGQRITLTIVEFQGHIVDAVMSPADIDRR